jgi:hypothetical protein
MNDRESKSVKGKRCHSAAASATSPTITALNSKSGLGGQKPDINCLKYDIASDYERERKTAFTAR